MAIPHIARQLADFETNDLVSILYSSMKPGLKKRELKRQMFAVCLQSMGLLAKAIKATERMSSLDPSSSKDHLAAVEDLKSNYFDVYRVSKGLILKPEMKE
jgi:hypothetical protein